MAAGGFKIAEAYVDITARNLMADALASAITQIKGVGAEAEAVGAKSSATGLLGSKAFLAIGAAAAGGAVEVVKMAGDFEASTNRLVTSAGESRTNIGLIRDGILAMAGSVGVSAEQLSAAMYKVESGGQHGADALKVLQAAAQGAKTENADLTVVADALTSAMVDYKIPADQAATTTSKLVAATSQGKMTFQELAGSMSAILPVASANHVSLNDILGDLASMTVHGMSAEQASQNLADAIRHMAAPTQAQSKELASLGLNATEVAKSLGDKGLSGTINDISARIRSQMGPDGMVVVDLTNALKGMSPAVQELGNKVLDGSLTLKDFRKEVSTLDPIAAKQAQSFATLAGTMHGIGTEAKSGADVYQTYSGALKAAMGDATGMNVALMIGGENAGVTAHAISVVSGATAEAGNNVKGWADIQNTLNQKIAEAKAGLGAFGIEIGDKLLPVVSKLADAIAVGSDWLAKHKDAATAAAIVIGGVLTAAFLALGAAIWIAIAPFLPLGLAIAVVVAAGYELIKHWGDIKGVAGDVFGFIRDFVVGVWNTVSHTTMTVWDAITGYFTRLFAAHRDLIMGIYGPVRDFIIGVWNSVHDTTVAVWNAITSYFTDRWNEIKNVATNVWNAIVNFLTPGMNAFRGTFGGIWNGIVGDFNAIWGRVTGIAQTVWNNVVGAFKWGVNQVIDLVNRLVDGADVVLKFLLIPLIPHIPALEAGGVVGLAGGGTVGAGFTTNGPMAIVGEGNPNHPEYVIPTDPAHRGNALSLYQSLGAKLMAGGGIIDWIGSAVSKVEKWAGAGATGLMNQAVDGLAGGIPEPYRDMAASLGHKAVAAIKAMIDKAQAAMGSFSAPFTGSGAVKDWIQQALGLTGTPESWAGPLSVLIGRESGGNPNAINRTDSNAAAGHPSQGLMQTIPSTFNAYHQPGTSWNITDPVANIAAGINYIKARYGSIFNVQQANPNLPPKGYDAGGLLPTGLSLVRNSTGAPERVLNATQTAKLDRLLAGRAGGQSVTVNVTQTSGSPAETGRFVALALRTVG
jgi:SLT domain-containing protein